MKNTLYCVPYGQILLDKFVEECNTNKYGYDEAVFVLADDIACAKLQARCFSFDSLAKEILRLHGVLLNILSPFASKLLLKGLIEEMHAKGELNFFAGFPQSNSLCENVFSFFAELEKEMITPEDFVMGVKNLSEGKVLRAKDKEILTLYCAYRQILHEQKLSTESDVYLSAGDLLRNTVIQIPFKKVYISGFWNFTAVQRELIKQLSKICEIDICLCYQKEDVYKATQKAFEDIVGLGFSATFVEAEPSGKNPILERLSNNIFRFSDEKIEAGAAVRIKRFANRRQEMQEVVADIKKKLLAGVSAQDILLCVRNLSLYPGLKREFDIAGVPVCLADMARLSIQPSYRLLDSVLQVVSGDVKRGLQNFFNNFFVKESFDLDVSIIKKALDEVFFTDLSGAQAALGKVFVEDKALGDIFEQIFALFKNFPDFASADEFTALLLDYLQSLAIIPMLGDLYKKGKIDCAELKLLAVGQQKTLDKMGALRKEIALAGESGRKMLLVEYRKLFKQYFQDASFLLEEAYVNGIAVKSAAQVNETVYSHVYLLGLNEGEFPVFIQENWLYGDEDRKKLEQIGVLPSTAAAAAEEMFFFCSTLALAQKELWCSASLADNEIMSIYLDEISRLVAIPEIEQRQAGQILPASDVIANEDMLACFLLASKQTDCQWLADYLGEDFMVRAGSEQPYRTGFYAGDLTQSEAVTLIRRLSNFSFDAGKLESYAFCPFRFLLEHVWRPVHWQQAVEEIRTNIKGTFYHECLKRFLAEYKGQSLACKTFDELCEKLESVLELTAKEFLDKGWLEATYLSEQEFSDMKEALFNWLKAEVAYQENNKGAFYPFYLEWPFENLVLKADFGEFAVKGRIDRVDSDGESYFVTDYKMRTTPKKADLVKGLDLQIPLYLLAVEQFLGQPLGGGYFSVENAKRDGGFWLNKAGGQLSFCGRALAGQKELADSDWEEYRKIFLATIKSLAEGIIRGDFSPKPKGECPFYCLGQGVCRVAQSKETGFDDA